MKSVKLYLSLLLYICICGITIQAKKNYDSLLMTRIQRASERPTPYGPTTDIYLPECKWRDIRINTSTLKQIVKDAETFVRVYPNGEKHYIFDLVNDYGSDWVIIYELVGSPLRSGLSYHGYIDLYGLQMVITGDKTLFEKYFRTEAKSEKKLFKIYCVNQKKVISSNAIEGNPSWWFRITPYQLDLIYTQDFPPYRTTDGIKFDKGRKLDVRDSWLK